MNQNFNKKAVVILSGGMDSTLSSYIAKNSGYELIAIHFNYGQRTQDRELKAFRDICKELNVLNKYGIEKGVVPITYVPFRNGIFLSIASAIAEKENATAIYIGVVEEDSSGYPDCSDNFIQKMQNAINEGTKEDTKIEIITPLVHLSKAQIVEEAIKLNAPLERTWACYKEEEIACGVCDSCRLRLNGFKEANQKDLIPYKES